MYPMNKIPLHKMIYDSIAKKITAQDYHIGDALPSESELERTFQVSRTPIRQALKQLEMDGLIYRLQGKGSFVANYMPIGNWTAMTGFQDLYNEEWQKIFARTLEVGRIRSPFHAQLLRVQENAELIHLKRIRYFNGEPVIYLEHYLNLKLPLDIFRKNGDFISIDQLLNDEQGIEFTSVKEKIEAVTVSESIAEQLHLKNGAPVVRSTRISFDQEGQPVDVTVNYFSSDKWTYRINFNKK
ncbi:transcriptional regulator [Sporolactobacillus terrae]|uniref:Transcriptional regulator n=2 Tax=Sporolactobacillus terrae TaxID=269673 RepID=A0A5K7WU72_9BACL|nr:transcriptional regulator [Sporolactobacillus terrae]